MRTVAQAHSSAVVGLGNTREWSFSGMTFEQPIPQSQLTQSYLGVPMPIPKREDTASALDNASCKVKEAALGMLASAVNPQGR